MPSDAPISTDRKVIEALKGFGAGLAYIDDAVLFEGSPFDAVDQALLQKGGRALVLGMERDPASVRTGASDRRTTRLTIQLVVLQSFSGRQGREADILSLVDAGVAVASDCEAWGAAGLKTAAGLSGEILNLRVGDVEVLADPDGNFGAREIPVTVTINRQ